MMVQASPPAVPKGKRALLARLVAASGDVIAIDDAVAVLGMSRKAAVQQLSRWGEQGWLSRVGPGRYVPVPLESLGKAQVLDDPWVLVPELFAPAYIGGRTAAEHWDLTEQIFTDIVVLSARRVGRKEQSAHGARFLLTHVPEGHLFGLRPVWRHRTRVMVSDVPWTIVDMLALPEIGGGVQHVADCLQSYLAHPDRDDGVLLEYARRLGNGAVFKRLGFLLEGNPLAGELPREAHLRMTQGLARLDPGAPCPRVVSRWRLRVPEHWLGGGSDDRTC